MAVIRAIHIDTDAKIDETFLHLPGFEIMIQNTESGKPADRISLQEEAIDDLDRQTIEIPFQIKISASGENISSRCFLKKGHLCLFGKRKGIKGSIIGLEIIGLDDTGNRIKIHNQLMSCLFFIVFLLFDLSFIDIERIIFRIIQIVEIQNSLRIEKIESILNQIIDKLDENRTVAFKNRIIQIIFLNLFLIKFFLKMNAGKNLLGKEFLSFFIDKKFLWKT